MEASIQQLHLRDSQLQGSDGYYAWQSQLDLLRLQKLPGARHAVQRCRAAHKKEQEEARARSDAASHGDAGPDDAVAPDLDEGAEGSSKKILCKLAVNTGLSFFFYMLERDPEAKGFLLQSSASVLAELPPLALHAGLGRLELESLAKVQSFLEKTIMEAPHPEYSKPRREDQSFADHALSSLISFALARGSLGTDLVLARLLFSCPHILKSHHLKQLRCICSISQTWNSDASSSSTSRVRVFRPQPGSPDELVEAWELQVLPLLKVCIAEEEARREKWMPIASALQGGKHVDAKRLVLDLLASAGNLALEMDSVTFPTPESLEQQRASVVPACGDDGSMDDGSMGPEGFLNRVEHVLATGGACSGGEACAVLMSCLQLLARRLDLHRMVPTHASCQAPAHCVAECAASSVALYSFLQDVCAGAGAVGTSARAARGDTREECSRQRIVNSWLELLRVNLEWKARCSFVARHSAAPTAGAEPSIAPSGLMRAPGCAESQTRATEMEQLETRLREYILQEQGCALAGGGGVAEGHPLSAALQTSEARFSALDCYSAGIPLFFQRPAHLVAALTPLLQSVRSGTASPFSKKMCARLLWNFGDYQMLWSSLMSIADAAEGAEAADVGRSDSGKPKTNLGCAQDCEGIVGILDCVLSSLFHELRAYLAEGVPAGMGPECLAGSSIKLEVPVSWGWGRFTRSSMRADGKTVQKISVNPDYSVALSSVGFATGVHCWVIRVDICQRLHVGVCAGTVDVDRRVNAAWGWHSHGTMSGPEQADKEIGDYSNRDELCLKLDMERGTLEFFKNGELKGCLGKVTGEVFPFVCMDYEGEQVTLLRQFDVIEREAGIGEHLDFAIVCSRTLHNFTSLLNALMEEDCTHKWLQHLAAAVLVRILDQLALFLAYIDEHHCEFCANTSIDPLDKTPAQAQRAHANTESELRTPPATLGEGGDGRAAGSCPQQNKNAGNGCAMADGEHRRGDRRDARRQRGLLAVLELMVLGSPGCPRTTVDNWLSSVLVFAARLEPIASECTGLLPSMVKCVMSQRKFLRRYHPLLMYHGVHFRSFVLSGMLFCKPNVYCSVEHTGPCEGAWTVEVMVKRGFLTDGCAMSILFSSRDFAVSIDQPKRDPGTLQLIDHTFGAGYGQTPAEVKTKIWQFDAVCPGDTWMLVAVVCDDNGTAICIDGFKVGSVPKSFPLELTAVGGCPRNPAADFLCGSVREVRVLARALSHEELLASVHRGLADARMEPGLADDLLLFLEFPGKGDRVVSERGPQSGTGTMVGVGVGGSAAQPSGGAAQPPTGLRDDAMRLGVGASGGGEAEEEHWISSMAKLLNGLTASMATSLLRGQAHSEKEAVCTAWLDSALFAPGYRSGGEEEHPFIQHVLQAQQTADAEPLECREHVQVLDQLLQPLLAVRQSPHLDALERAVMATVLYHSGELRVLHSAARTEEALAICKAVSLAARTVRRHAMEMRDLANLALKDNQEPRDWSFFCAPILDRCCLLLRLAPVYGRSCERPSASGSADNVSCETEGRWRAAEDWGEVSGSGVRGVGGAFAGGLSEEGGAAACSSLFSSVHNDVKGGTHVQQIATLVTGFLKENLEPKVLVAGLQARKTEAVQVQAGLSALVQLLGDLGMIELKQDVLCLLANAANPWLHYLAAISASGHQAEDKVRGCFHRLMSNLVAVLHVGHTGARADVVISAARALTVALDHRDLSHLLSTQLVDWLNAFWVSTAHLLQRGRRRGEEGPGEGAGASGETEPHACHQLLCNAGVMQALNRLLISLLLALGANAPSLGVSESPIILDCAHKAVTALFAKATSQASGAGGSWKYWHGQWKCSRGKARAHKLFLMLKAGDDRMSAQQFIQGSARYKGCTYQVHGTSRERPALPHLVVLYCFRVACEPGSPSQVLPFDAEGASDVLTLVGSISNDLRSMKGQLFQQHCPLPLLESEKSEGMGEHDGVFELFSLSCVPVPRSYFSRYVRRVISLSAGGFIQFVGEDEECGVVQACQPVTPADNYIQVHVIESQKESAVAIGVAGRNYALDQMPGWQEGSIAFHLDDGNLFVQAGDPARFGPVCVQGDIVGCRVKFWPDGVSPKSITWTRNGELIGTKSIHRIPGLSASAGQLFFSIGLNRPGEKILVSTGTSPDLPSELDSSSTQCNSHQQLFDMSDGETCSQDLAVNAAAHFESNGKASVLSLAARPTHHASVSASGPVARQGQALYAKSLTFSRHSSFRTQFVVAQKSVGQAGGSDSSCARLSFVLLYDALLHGEASGTEPAAAQEAATHGTPGSLWSPVETGQLSVVLAEVNAKHSAPAQRSKPEGSLGAEICAADDFTESVSVDQAAASAQVGERAAEGPCWQLLVLAGGRLLAHSKEFAKSGQSVQIWIEYTPESQLLSIFAADHSLRGFKPSEPAVTTHMDLASYIGDTARVGFCCENAKAGVAGENSVLAQSFEITSWSFEVSQRPWAPALTPDASSVRETASRELTAILSGLHAIGHNSMIGDELQQPHWQSLMWALAFSNDLDIQARSYALQAVALSLKQPDAQSAATCNDFSKSIEKLLWLVAKLSPEGNLYHQNAAARITPSDLHAKDSVAGSVNGLNGRHGAGAHRTQYCPSIVTWMLPPLVQANSRGRAGGKEEAADQGVREKNSKAGVPLAPCLAFRSKVITLIKHLSSLPHRRACITAVLVSSIRRIAQACAGRDEGLANGQRKECGMQHLQQHDLASVLVLGGVLDVLVSRAVANEGHSKDGVQFDAAVLNAFLEMACTVLARIALGDSQADNPDASLLLQVVRTRVVKALWELLSLPPVASLVSSKYPVLIGMLISFAETAITSVPIAFASTSASSDASENGTQVDAKPSFDVSSILSSRVSVTNSGSTCDIRSGADCSVMVGPTLHKASGRHYLEFKVLFSRGDYSFVGCAIASYRTSAVIGDNKGSWAWANDGDFKAGGDWCGDRGLASFRAGDHVGLLVDMDKSTLRFTKNGKLLRKSCSLSSATATGDGIRFAVGSTSHLKIEIVETCRYKHVRDDCVGTAPTPWLTVEMLIAKSHLLSLEGGGAERGTLGADASDTYSGAAHASDRLSFDVASSDPLSAAAAATASAILDQNARRQRFCRAAARYLDENGHMIVVDGGKHAGGNIKESAWLGDALLLKETTEEIPFLERAVGAVQGKPGGVAGEAGKGAGGAVQGWTSPWQTCGNKSKFLLQSEEALLIHFSRLCVLDLLRARHVPAAMMIPADRLISLLSPFFPKGYPLPRAVCTTGPYANITPVLDEVLAGWISARGDGNAQALAHELRTLAHATSQALQQMCLQRRLSTLGVTFLLEWPSADDQRTQSLMSTPSVVTWAAPSKMELAAKGPPGDERDVEKIASFQLAAWLATHLVQRYALQGHHGCGPAMGELQERMLEAVSVTSSQHLCRLLLQALVVAVTHSPAHEDKAEGTTDDQSAGQGGNEKAGSGRWSTWTLEVLKKLRAAALQQLVEQQNPNTAKQRVQHTPLLQALIATVVAVDSRLRGNQVRDILMAQLAAAASLAPPAQSPLLIAPGATAHQRSPKTQKVVQLLLEMGFTQKQIEAALWATANENIEDLTSQRGTQVLNYLSTCAHSCPPSEGNFPLAPHPFGVPSCPDLECRQVDLNQHASQRASPRIQQTRASHPELTDSTSSQAGARVDGGGGGERGAGGVGDGAAASGGSGRGMLLWQTPSFANLSLFPGVRWAKSEGAQTTKDTQQQAPEVRSNAAADAENERVMETEEETAPERLWESIDGNMCKALRTMESFALLSLALRGLENGERPPLWLLDLAKDAARDQRQFWSWDDGDPQSGMTVGDLCLVCKRSPAWPSGHWSSVTGNLPFDTACEAASTTNFFSIRVSRIMPSKEAAGSLGARALLSSLRLRFGVVRTSEVSPDGSGVKPATTHKSLLARGYAAGCCVLCCSLNTPVVRTFWPSAWDKLQTPARGEDGTGASNRPPVGAEGERAHMESDAAPQLTQKSVVVCEDAVNVSPAPPPLSEEHVREMMRQLHVDPTRLNEPRMRAGCESGAANASSIGSVPALASVLLTVQVKADGKINFFEGQGPAAVLLAQSEMAYGSSSPGTLLPFVSLLEDDVFCEVLQNCSAPPILDSGNADKGCKSLHVRSASVLAGLHGFPARNALSRASLDWEMASDPQRWPPSMDSLLVQYASERAAVKGKKLAQLSPSDLFDDDKTETMDASAPTANAPLLAAANAEAGVELCQPRADDAVPTRVPASRTLLIDEGGGQDSEQHQRSSAIELASAASASATVGGVEEKESEKDVCLAGPQGAKSGNDSGLLLPGLSPATPASFGAHVSPILTRQPSTRLSPAVRSTSVTSPNVAAAMSHSPLKIQTSGAIAGVARHLGETEACESSAAKSDSDQPGRVLGMVSEAGTGVAERVLTELLARPGVRREVTMLTLSQLPPCAVRARLAILKALNEVARLALPLVDLKQYEDPHNIAHLLARNKGRLFMYNKDAVLNKSLDLSRDSADVPHITLNRGTTPADRRKWDKTIFYQVFRGLEERTHSLRAVDRRGSGKQSWVTTFEGEGGSDHGGLFRDSLREICAELQSPGGYGGLQLLRPCPNQRLGRGANQDKWIPHLGAGASASDSTIGAEHGVCGGVKDSAGASSALGRSPAAGSQGMRMLRFLGALMGASLRTDSALELDLPSLVWKPLVGELCDFSDLAAIDESLAAELKAIHGCPSPQHWETLGRRLRWRVPSMSGRWIELIPGGARRKVLWEERQLFVEEAVRVRLAECDAEVEAIKEGFSSVVPSLALPLLTWRDLEAKVCGAPIIDVDVFKKMTDHNLPRKDKHPVAVRFWQVVHDMSNSDRAALLAFASGRRRLPSPNSGGHFRIELLHGRGDEALPEAHTCFFTIDLPQYSSTRVMREKLLYAIHNCSAIDKDFTARGGALYDPEEDPSQLLDAAAAAAAGAGGGARETSSGEAGAATSVSGIATLLSSLLTSPPLTPGSEDGASSGRESIVAFPADGDEACAGGKPLTAEGLRNCWSSVRSRAFAPVNAALSNAGQPMCIPRDGGHDDCAGTLASHELVRSAAPALSAHTLASMLMAASPSSVVGQGTDACRAHASAHNAARLSHDARTGDDGGCQWGGLFGWDPGMLDRMQAADVYSGMSGIDHVSESGDASGCDDEDELEEMMEERAMEEEEDDENSEPQDGDEDEWGDDSSHTSSGDSVETEEMTYGSDDSGSDGEDADEDDDSMDHDVDSEDMYDETEEEDEGGYEDSLRGQSDPDDED